MLLSKLYTFDFSSLR